MIVGYIDRIVTCVVILNGSAHTKATSYPYRVEQGQNFQKGDQVRPNPTCPRVESDHIFVSKYNFTQFNAHCHTKSRSALICNVFF